MQLSQHTAEEILRWASENPLVEVSGFVSHWGSSETVVPMQNISRTPATDFAWAPDEMVMQYAMMDARGEEPLAFYHSHPNGRSDPSETDMRAAMQVGLMYLIAYPEMQSIFSGESDRPIRQERVWHLSAWHCLEPGILVGEPLDLR